MGIDGVAAVHGHQAMPFDDAPGPEKGAAVQALDQVNFFK